MYARICANTGWTWTYVREELDLPTVAALDLEWGRCPPVHHLVAAYLKYKPAKPAAVVDEATDIAPLLTEIGDVPIRKVAPLDTSAFDAHFPPAPAAPTSQE
jgi:hypothetical protein